MTTKNLRDTIDSVTARIDEWEKLYYRDWKRYGQIHSKFCELTNPYLKNCKNVLELGCGYGRDLIYLAKFYPTVEFVGIDSSAMAISLLLNDTKRERLKNLKAVANNWFGVSYNTFTDCPIDAIISHFFLHLFLEQERNEILKKSAQIIRPKGLLISSLVSIHDTKFAKGRQIEDGTFACYQDRPWHYLHFFEENEIRKIFFSNGFKVEFIFEYIETEEILNDIENTCTWFVVCRKI